MAKPENNGMTNASGIAYGELIRRQRKIKKMNQEELGALVRVGKNAVGAWEAGRSRPDVSSVPIICEALDLSLEEFFGLSGTGRVNPGESQLSPSEMDSLVRRYSALNGYNRRIILREMDVLKEMQNRIQNPPRKVVRIFRNELAASAGPGETLEAARGEVVFLYADSATEAADEIIRVNGDSMEPTYYDGDLVLVKHVSSVRPGEIGVFIAGDTGYIKESRRDCLHSHNPAYPDLYFAGEEVRCAGKVLGRVTDEELADEDSYRAWIDFEEKGRA